jgi:hypothetical protein
MTCLAAQLMRHTRQDLTISQAELTFLGQGGDKLLTISSRESIRAYDPSWHKMALKRTLKMGLAMAVLSYERPFGLE